MGWKWGNVVKVAFDVQLLIKGDKTGIGWCAENILMRMPQYNEYSYQLNYFSLGYSKEQLENVAKYVKFGYHLNKCKWFHDVIYRFIWNYFLIPYKLFFGNRADITFFFNYVIPPGVKGKKITIVHDMAYKAYPETVRKRTRRLLDLALEKSCARADRIITVSEFSKQELIKYLGIRSDKIVVMPNGVDFSLYHPNYEEKEVAKIKKKYSIEGKYFLYLGTLEPRKNIERLILAYAKLIRETNEVPKLVLAGRKGWMYNSIFETVKTLKLENNVIFTGYIEAKDTPILMKGAEIFLFPSLYEGFGMPPLEAMACGTPVLVSNVSSLPEIVGEAGIFVDPFSIDSIEQGLLSLTKNQRIRDELILKGLQRVRKYSWDKAVRIIKNVLDELI